MGEFQKYLIPLLRASISNSISNIEINQLVKIAHQFATIRLAQLLKRNKISAEIMPHSLSTTALDCVAEIFERDEDGNFIELINYFSDERSINNCSDEAIVSNFRTLVFSKLNDGIFRLYREYDPITSKILRNIKLLLKSENTMVTFYRLGILYISSSNCEYNEHLQEYPKDELCSQIIYRLKGKDDLRSLIRCMIDQLTENSNYRKFVSIIDAALIVKQILQKDLPHLAQLYEIDKNLISNDLETIVKYSLKEFEEYLNVNYLQKNKIDTHTYQLYVNGISQLITRKFILNDGAEYSYYDYMKIENPLMNYKEYRKRYRAHFEYLAKTAKKIVVDNLRTVFE